MTCVLQSIDFVIVYMNFSIKLVYSSDKNMQVWHHLSGILVFCMGVVFFSSTEPKAQDELLWPVFAHRASSVIRLSTIYLKDISS